MTLVSGPYVRALEDQNKRLQARLDAVLALCGRGFLLPSGNRGLYVEDVRAAAAGETEAR